jgi:FMN phosphatase YigB (HAD superfamily)
LKQAISLIITDLDNTLFDWFDIWAKSFSALLTSLVANSGIPASELIPEIKKVHERHGTAEYAFLLEELPSLIRKVPGQDPSLIYSHAIEAYRRARESALQLYPRVADTLDFLRSKGCRIVGYTESMEYYSAYRLSRLGLDRRLDYLYTPPDHDLPDNRMKGSSPLKHTQVRHTPRGELKPNPQVLQTIISEVGGTKGSAAYIGDSLMKDVTMAQQAGVVDVWAKYGVAQKRVEYELLRQVTHWTDEMVEKERLLTRKDVMATHVLDKDFGEMRDLFEYIPFK